MDPNATLKEMRELYREMTDPDETHADVVYRFCELFRALDGWLSGNGFPPRAWAVRACSDFPDDQPDACGDLAGEPCRFCHKAGGVGFVVDDRPLGKHLPQVVYCSLCKSSWNADSPLA